VVPPLFGSERAGALIPLVPLTEAPDVASCFALREGRVRVSAAWITAAAAGSAY
jgi:hypothetical protein